MESFKELFEMVKEYTRQYVIDSKELSEIAYQVWIKSLEPVSFDGNTAVLYIKAEFMKKIVEEKIPRPAHLKAFEAVVASRSRWRSCAKPPPIRRRRRSPPPRCRLPLPLRCCLPTVRRRST